MLAIVTRVRDREEHLYASLPNWVAAAAVDEIVIVDYGSLKPINPSILELSNKIRLCTVRNAPVWKSGKAINIGVRLASADLILRLDCDINRVDNLAAYLDRKTEDHFLSGRMGDDVGFNGFFGQCIVSKRQWEAAGGYHEFMIGWGFDDSDFYARLVQKGFERQLFDIGDFGEISHSDAVRVAATMPCFDFIRKDVFLSKGFQLRLNQFISKLVPWDGQLAEKITFEQLSPWRVEVHLSDEGAFERQIVRYAVLLCALSLKAPFGPEASPIGRLADVRLLKKLRWTDFLIQDLVRLPAMR